MSKKIKEETNNDEMQSKKPLKFPPSVVSGFVSGLTSTVVGYVLDLNSKVKFLNFTFVLALFAVFIFYFTLILIRHFHLIKTPESSSGNSTIWWLGLTISFSILVSVLFNFLPIIEPPPPTSTITASSSPVDDNNGQATETSVPLSSQTLTPEQAETLVSALPEETAILSPAEVWDIYDGCISSEWRYWPYLPSKSHVGTKHDGNCWDFSYYGMREIEGDGLSIVFDEADGFYTFGISQEVPETIGYFKIRLELSGMEVGLEKTTIVKLGLINTDDHLEGKYFAYIQKVSSQFSPLFFIDDPYPNFPNERVYGYLEHYQGSINHRYKELIIECDILGKQTMDCRYTIDAHTREEKNIALPREWDSLYVGYELSTGGSLNFIITDLLIESYD